MSARRDKIRAGIFVIVSVALLFALVILIAGFKIFKTTRTYYVRFNESVTGLEESSVVRFRGVPVGRVSDIGFTDNASPEIRVTIEVDPKAPIRQDTVAQLKPQGITGVFYIDLDGGDPDKPLLPANGTIRTRESVTTELLTLLEDIKSTVGQLNAILVENREGISSALKEIENAAKAVQTPIARLDTTLVEAGAAIGDLKDRMAGAVSSAESSFDAIRAFAESPELAGAPSKLTAALDRAATVFDSANALIEDTRGAIAAADVKRVISALENTLTQLNETGRSVADTVTEVQLGVRENRGTLLRIVGDFRAFSHTMRVLADEIRQEPSRLLFGRRPSTREEGR